MTSISAERTGLARVGGTGGTLRRREQWGSRFDYTNSRPVDEPADYQFVHITVTNPRNYASNDKHAQAIEAIGKSRFPATGGSYNRLSMQSGAMYELQPIGRRGAHTINDKRIARCSTSGCPSRGGSVAAPSFNLNVNARAYAIAQNVGDSVSATQVDELARAMARDRLAGFVRRGAAIHGHRCVAGKDCPGSRMWAEMADLEVKVNYYVRVGLGDAPEPEVVETPELEEDMPYIIKKGSSVYMYFSGNGCVNISEASAFALLDQGVKIYTGVAIADAQILQGRFGGTT
ncbi:hypothetical protein [Streptomyces sp.]|uniref:hypothetical protein n=1 Tax=Streptomyces sp. TaxID=1931 RepID=UPI002F930CBD